MPISLFDRRKILPEPFDLKPCVNTSDHSTSSGSSSVHKSFKLFIFTPVIKTVIDEQGTKTHVFFVCLPEYYFEKDELFFYFGSLQTHKIFQPWIGRTDIEWDFGRRWDQRQRFSLITFHFSHCCRENWLDLEHLNTWSNYFWLSSFHVRLYYTAKVAWKGKKFPARYSNRHLKFQFPRRFREETKNILTI